MEVGIITAANANRLSLSMLIKCNKYSIIVVITNNGRLLLLTVLLLFILLLLLFFIIIIDMIINISIIIYVIILLLLILAHYYYFIIALTIVITLLLLLLLFISNWSFTGLCSVVLQILLDTAALFLHDLNRYGSQLFGRSSFRFLDKTCYY